MLLFFVRIISSYQYYENVYIPSSLPSEYRLAIASGQHFPYSISIYKADTTRNSLHIVNEDASCFEYISAYLKLMSKKYIYSIFNGENIEESYCYATFIEEPESNSKNVNIEGLKYHSAIFTNDALISSAIVEVGTTTFDKSSLRRNDVSLKYSSCYELLDIISKNENMIGILYVGEDKRYCFGSVLKYIRY